jgi:hypothetical protein
MAPSLSARRLGRAAQGWASSAASVLLSCDRKAASEARYRLAPERTAGFSTVIASHAFVALAAQAGRAAERQAPT